MDTFEPALYGVIIPIGLVLIFGGLALWRARAHACSRLAALVVPLATAVAIALSFQVRFSGLPEKWHRIVFTAVGLMLVWAVGLMFRTQGRRGLALAAAGTTLAAALVAGAVMWPTILPSRPEWMHGLPFVLAGFVTAVLYPLAAVKARRADALAIAAAVGLMVPVVVVSGQAKFGELLLPSGIAAGFASVFALAMRGQRWGAWREGIAAGALGTALLLPMWAVLVYSYSYNDLKPQHVWGLALPCVAPALLWVGRVGWIARRPLVAGILVIVLVAAVAGAGTALALSVTDTAAYDPGF
jgi:hypothetical protein